jgi:hypothetical protein
MSELNDMTCGELTDVAAELALGVLTGRERAVAVAHLDTCEACREDVRQLMATGEQLLELLPSAEPPVGFETRVLERLGLPVTAREPLPAQEEPRGGTHSRLISRPEQGQNRRVAGGTQPSSGQPSSGQPSAPPAGPGGTRRPGRMRRVLAVAAMGLAVIAAGLGGWRIGLGAAPAVSSAAESLTSASLFSAAHKNVGEIYLYSGKFQWMFMSVDLESGNETVQCQLVGKDGRVTTVGSFPLADGYGSWGSPEPRTVGTVSGARLVSANGTLLATAAFPTW